MGGVTQGKTEKPKLWDALFFPFRLLFRLIRWVFRWVAKIFCWVFVDIRHLPLRIRIERLRAVHWLKNASLRKALTAYILLALLAAAAATLVTSFLISRLISRAYDGQTNVVVGAISLIFSISTPASSGFIELLHWLGVLLPLLYFLGAIVGAGAAFYRYKMKTPLGVLTESAQKIASNDLDFHVSYPILDEMGDLCRAFEKMRFSLAENNREMWRMMEEHKRLNAAFAHDLRTPLTVLRGYSDFLSAYVPEGKVTEEKLLSTLSTMSQHIARLESYAKTMNAVQKLDDIEPEPVACAATGFFSTLAGNFEILSQKHRIAIRLKDGTGRSTFFADPKIVTEVVENLVSNALCYAKEQIEVAFTAGEKYLRVTVSDDGKGFTPEDLHSAKKAFYKDSSHFNSNHFGLGLNICDILCQKHGGGLHLANGKNGGAATTALFSLTLEAQPPKGEGETDS